ncbi:NUDIX hydrolase [Tropicimonas sp. IMCC34011]|uniref:NUDIX hydrolase n=1 Tax=Tropicimonas sp. IMCC34011 TaxID=2248759 RepID=UPI000E242CAB|nr:NUDIX hydrolase [Tropicimonas sp. IMCC34011]
MPLRKKNGRLEVCLLTSRDSGRWIIPKGWPMKNKAGWRVAEIEAFEEGGLAGRLARRPMGSFRYVKGMEGGVHIPVVVHLYAMRVRKQHGNWKEKKQRTRRWTPLKEAAEMVEEPELAELFLTARRAGLRRLVG